MAVFLAFVLLGGISLLVVTGVLVLLQLGDLRAARVLRRVEPTPVATWRPRAGRVAAEGITDFGPGGRQIGPVSGEVCAWYHVTVVRVPSRGWSEEPHDELLDITSPGLPAFGDHSGRVLLDPRVLDDLRNSDPPVTQRTIKFVSGATSPDSVPPVVSPAVFQDLRRGETLHLNETRLPYALEVFALGRIAGPPVTLAAIGGELTVFAAAGREQVINGRRENLATGRWMIRGFGGAGLIVTTIGTALLYLVF